jgi:hypothetical protein
VHLIKDGEYRDIWGNAAVLATAAHRWGAARFCAYLIVSGIFDWYPNFQLAEEYTAAL